MTPDDHTISPIHTITFETLAAEDFQIGRMAAPVAIVTFLRYVG